MDVFLSLVPLSLLTFQKKLSYYFYLSKSLKLKILFVNAHSNSGNILSVVTWLWNSDVSWIELLGGRSWDN